MNILIAGVGGQGALLAAKVIGSVVMAKGFDVKVSEIHGMSQRGGSVETYVRYSKHPICSPIIDKGDADIILGLEALETLRAIGFLKKDGRVVMNTIQINPMTVILGMATYPENVPGKLAQMGVDVLSDDFGKEKTTNITMLGAMSKLLEFSQEDWKDSIKKCVKPDYVDINLEAFEMGRNLG